MTGALKHVRLGDILDIRDGTHDTPKYVEHGIPLITSKNLTDHGLCFRNISYISENDHKEISKRSAVGRGDILYGMIGTIGKPTLVETDMQFSIKNVALFKLSNPEIDNRYFLYLLKSDEINKQISQASKGGTQKFVSLGALRDLKAALPPLPEQRRIAAILDKADALRAKRREAIAKLDQLLRSVFLQMFGDPVTNPKGWKIGKLADLGELDRGVSRHRPRGAPELLGGNHPLIQTGDVARSGGYIREFTTTYSDAGLAQSKKWPAGTLCITIAANIADTGILTFDACFPDSVVGFTANQNSNAEFIQTLMSFLREILEEKAPQVAQKNINLAILRELPVPVPPVEQQQKWAVFSARIERMKQDLRTAEKCSSKLFESLQQKAFSGVLKL